MPNYIRTQNPWLTAANAMQGVVDPLNQAMLQVPRIRMQMQQHADEMGLRQAGLDLQQQEFVARQPYYIAQANAESQQADLYKQQAAAQQQLNANSEDAGLAALFSSLLKSGVIANPNQTNYIANTPANQLAIQQGQLRRSLYGSAASSPTAAERLLQPNNLPQNATAFDVIDGSIIGRGQSSAPVGNTVWAPEASPFKAPVIQQQGQFKPGAPGPRSAIEQIIIDAARGLSSGRAFPEDIAAALQMTNMIGGAKSPVQVPGTGNELTATNSVGKRIKLVNGQWVPVP